MNSTSPDPAKQDILRSTASPAVTLGQFAEGLAGRPATWLKSGPDGPMHFLRGGVPAAAACGAVLAHVEAASAVEATEGEKCPNCQKAVLLGQ